jgi:hypothetical protein
MRVPSYTSLDDALDTLSGYGTQLKNGNSNHAPMVAEALCAMGRPDAVMPWIARYRDRMLLRGMSRAVLKFARQASLVDQATRPWVAVQGRS